MQEWHIEKHYFFLMSYNHTPMGSKFLEFYNDCSKCLYNSQLVHLYRALWIFRISFGMLLICCLTIIGNQNNIYTRFSVVILVQTTQHVLFSYNMNSRKYSKLSYMVIKVENVRFFHMFIHVALQKDSIPWILYVFCMIG